MSCNHWFYALHQCAMHPFSLRPKRVRDTELMIIGVPVDSERRKKRSRIQCVDRSIKLHVYIVSMRRVNSILWSMEIPLWLVNLSSIIDSYLSTIDTYHLSHLRSLYLFRMHLSIVCYQGWQLTYFLKIIIISLLFIKNKVT